VEIGAKNICGRCGFDQPQGEAGEQGQSTNKTQTKQQAIRTQQDRHYLQDNNKQRKGRYIAYQKRISKDLFFANKKGRESTTSRIPSVPPDPFFLLSA
jgi:hypothetical protein